MLSGLPYAWTWLLLLAARSAVHDEEDINVENDPVGVCNMFAYGLFAFVTLSSIQIMGFKICGLIFFIQNHLSSLVGNKWLSPFN